jgi:hypothetical protein
LTLHQFHAYKHDVLSQNSCQGVMMSTIIMYQPVAGLQIRKVQACNTYICTVSSQLFMTHQLLYLKKKKTITHEILSFWGVVDRGMIKRKMKQKKKNAKCITF